MFATAFSVHWRAADVAAAVAAKSALVLVWLVWEDCADEPVSVRANDSRLGVLGRGRAVSDVFGCKLPLDLLAPLPLRSASSSDGSVLRSAGSSSSPPSAMAVEALRLGLRGGISSLGVERSFTSLIASTASRLFADGAERPIQRFAGCGISPPLTASTLDPSMATLGADGDGEVKDGERMPLDTDVAFSAAV